MRIIIEFVNRLYIHCSFTVSPLFAVMIIANDYYKSHFIVNMKILATIY